MFKRPGTSFRRLVGASLLTWIGAASAMVVDVPGEHYSFDAETGLYWLDLTETVNLSYDAVSQALSDTSSSWRYASRTEIKHLLEESFPSYVQSISPDGEPVPDPFYAHWQADVNGEAQAFIETFGDNLGVLDGQYGTLGLYDFDFGSKCASCGNAHALAGAISRDGKTEFLVTMQGGAVDQYSTPYYGHYLVTTSPEDALPDFAKYPRVPAIPEPQSYALLLVGLGVVGAAVRSRKRHTLNAG